MFVLAILFFYILTINISIETYLKNIFIYSLTFGVIVSLFYIIPNIEYYSKTQIYDIFDFAFLIIVALFIYYSTIKFKKPQLDNFLFLLSSILVTLNTNIDIYFMRGNTITYYVANINDTSLFDQKNMFYNALIYIYNMLDLSEIWIMLLIKVFLLFLFIKLIYFIVNKYNMKNSIILTLLCFLSFEFSSDFTLNKMYNIYSVFELPNPLALKYIYIFFGSLVLVYYTYCDNQDYFFPIVIVLTSLVWIPYALPTTLLLFILSIMMKKSISVSTIDNFIILVSIILLMVSFKIAFIFFLFGIMVINRSKYIWMDYCLSVYFVITQVLFLGIDIAYINQNQWCVILLGIIAIKLYRPKVELIYAIAILVSFVLCFSHSILYSIFFAILNIYALIFVFNTLLNLEIKKIYKNYVLFYLFYLLLVPNVFEWLDTEYYGLHFNQNIDYQIHQYQLNKDIEVVKLRKTQDMYNKLSDKYVDPKDIIFEDLNYIVVEREDDND